MAGKLDLLAEFLQSTLDTLKQAASRERENIRKPNVTANLTDLIAASGAAGEDIDEMGQMITHVQNIRTRAAFQKAGQPATYIRGMDDTLDIIADALSPEAVSLCEDVAETWGFPLNIPPQLRRPPQP